MLRQSPIFSIFESDIVKKTNMLDSGTFQIYLDTTHREHKISEHVITFILNAMDNF
jgi:hypothetical protein